MSISESLGRSLCGSCWALAALPSAPTLRIELELDSPGELGVTDWFGEEQLVVMKPLSPSNVNPVKNCRRLRFFIMPLIRLIYIF